MIIAFACSEANAQLLTEREAIKDALNTCLRPESFMRLENYKVRTLAPAPPARPSLASIAGGSCGAQGGHRRSAAARRLHPGRVETRGQAAAGRLRHRPPRRRINGVIIGSEPRGYNGGAV
jgi:hypothetical protein